MKTLCFIFRKLCRNYFWLSALLLPGRLFGQDVFSHQATPVNTSGHITTLDHPSVNGKPSAVLFATHDYGKAGPYHPHELGVYYAAGKWRIFSQNRAAILANTKFNILVMNAAANAFVHTVSTANTTGHVTTLSHPLLDKDSSAVVILTQNWGTSGPYNPHHVGVHYNLTSNKWTIFNQDFAALPPQAKFNVLVLPQKKRVKINQAFMVGLKENGATTATSHIARLTHPALDGQADLSLLTTAHWGIQGPYNNNPTGVWYDGKQWTVYNENLKKMPTGVKFHVLRIEKSEGPSLAVVSSTNLYLDKVIYPERSPIRAELHLDQLPTTTALPNPYLLLAAPKSRDVEYVKLIPTDRPGVYRTEAAVPTRVHLSSAAATSLDGTLSLAPGEMFYAIYSPRERAADAGSLEGTDMVYDFGVAAEKVVSGSPVKVIPELSLTQDERNPRPGQKPVATLTTRGSLPIQVALNELIIYPLNRPQLDRFLAKTQGTIVNEYIPSPNTPYQLQSAYLVKVDLNRVNAGSLSQLRATWGLYDSLYVSKPDALKLVQLAIECLMDGYAVGLNPRLMEMSDRYGYSAEEQQSKPAAFAEPAFPRENLTSSLTDTLFDIPRLWAFMALFDKDQARIPVAFLDQGFAPNPDFRRPFFAECNLEGDDRCGPGAATGPPTVGNSFFGGRSWHGNGVVSVAGGVINNNFGVGGTGGQVVVPGLYRFGLTSYALEIGQGIRRAVEDGATVINISAGYPCRILTNILGWTPGICGTGDRALLCTAVTAGLMAANALICGQAALLAAIPIIGPFLAIPAVIACGAATLAFTTASAACFVTLIAGDVRGVMEDGVNFALSRGVTVVASAGNILSPTDLPPVIRDIVNLDRRRQTTEEWQPVPASIPGVICVGATTYFPPFANAHIFGSRVDIWAPEGSGYFEPDTLDNVSAPQRLGIIGGTSAAAPYISGLIANLQAIDPALNPRSPGLSATAIRGIPVRIRTLLASTAFTNAELGARGFTDSTGERGNLVNPMRLITRAARGVVPDFASRGYDNSLNFGGVERAPGDDAEARAQEASAVRNSSFTGTIITFPGAAGAAPIRDQDWYVWRTPDAPGFFRNGFVELIFPTAFGVLRINDDLVAPVSVRTLGDETIKRYAIPDLTGNVRFAILVSGDGSGSDNLYKLNFHAATHDPTVLLADRFDRARGNNNPVSPGNNNTRAAATLLGSHGLTWQSETGYRPLLFAALPEPGHEIKIPDLNFHNSPDADWFSFDVSPPRDGSGNCLPPMIRIQANANVLIELFNAEGQRLASGVGEITRSVRYQRDSYLPTDVQYFKLSPVTAGSFAAYDLSVVYEWPSAELCRPVGGLRLSGEATTAIDSTAHRELLVYPNPTKGIATIQLTGLPLEPDHSARIVIYDPQGNPINSRDFQDGPIQVDLSGHSKGIYLIQLILDGKEMLFKKLLNH